MAKLDRHHSKHRVTLAQRAYQPDDPRGIIHQWIGPGLSAAQDGTHGALETGGDTIEFQRWCVRLRLQEYDPAAGRSAQMILDCGVEISGVRRHRQTT